MFNKKAMNELKELLIKKYPNDIDRIILFGSRAENTENEYSDYDLLVILKNKYDWKLEKELKFATYDINIDYDILTDINLIDLEELNSLKGQLPFVQEAIQNGIVL